MTEQGDEEEEGPNQGTAERKGGCKGSKGWSIKQTGAVTNREVYELESGAGMECRTRVAASYRLAGSTAPTLALRKKWPDSFSA